MKKFIKIDYSQSISYIFCIDEISHIYFDSLSGKYVLALKSSIEYYLPDDFSIDEFYLEIEDRFPI